MSGLILPGDDVHSVADRIKHGDASIGWRGDPSMDCYYNTDTETVQVFGWDGRGDQYIAAEVIPAYDQGWRHTLLKKLKDGDWQDPGLVQRRMDWMAEPQRAKEAKLEEWQAEHAERMAWALRKDLGHMYGGLTKEIH